MNILYTDPEAVIATVEYTEYPTIQELLKLHGIDTVIKPAEADENGAPVGNMVDVYVRWSNATKATVILSGEDYFEIEYTKEPDPMHTGKATGIIVTFFPSLKNKPGIVLLIYVLLSMLVIFIVIVLNLNKQHKVF